MAIYRRSFLKAFEPLLSYGIALVELDGGVRLQAHVSDADKASATRTGDVVVLDFRVLLAEAFPVLMASKAEAGNGR